MYQKEGYLCEHLTNLIVNSSYFNLQLICHKLLITNIYLEATAVRVKNWSTLSCVEVPTNKFSIVLFSECITISNN